MEYCRDVVEVRQDVTGGAEITPSASSGKDRADRFAMQLTQNPDFHSSNHHQISSFLDM